MKLHAGRSGFVRLLAGIALVLGCSGDVRSGSSGGRELDTEVLVARSFDAGITWTPPAVLSRGPDTSAGSDVTPQVTTDLNGTWLAVWPSTSLSVLPRLDFDILWARSTDAGVDWTNSALLNTNADVDEEGDVNIQLTTDGQGVWIAVWHSFDSLGGSIGTDSDVFFACSENNGADWTDPAPLNTNAFTDTRSDENPQVTTDLQGNWVAVWHSNEDLDLDGMIGFDRDIFYALPTINEPSCDGISWSDPKFLNSEAPDDQDDSDPTQKRASGDAFVQLTTDRQGTWIAVWDDRQVKISDLLPLDWDIGIARSFDNGVSWTPQENLNNNHDSDAPGPKGHDNNPQVTTDAQGIWIAVWDSVEFFRNSLELGPDADILFACSTDKGATWTDPAPLNTNAGTDRAQDTNPQLTTDENGAWVAVWRAGASFGRDADILTARLIDDGATCDDGFTWSDPAQLDAGGAADDLEAGAPQVTWGPTSDPDGVWIATWQVQKSP